MLPRQGDVAGAVLEDRVAAEVPGQEDPDHEIDDEAADERQRQRDRTGDFKTPRSNSKVRGGENQ